MDYKNKVKKKKGCFSGCLIYVFLPLLIIAATFFIVRFINNKRQEKLTFSLNNRFVYEEKLTAEDKLTNAFENGEISADTYVLQMAYSIFETSKLDSKYQSDNAIDFAPNIVELFCRYIDELSDETKEYIANKIMQTNIRIHPDASNNKDTLENSWFPFVIHAYAGKYDVTVLDKAYLSPNGRFLFWYTETGNSAVDEKTIQQLANEVESISEKIEQFLGVQWKYNSSLHNNDSYIESVLDICIESVLDRSDINWREILDAFPVYVYEPPNKDGALAWYCKDLVWYEKALVDFVAPFLKEELMDYWSVYSLPYITIKSSSAKDMEDLYFILAHELTHHFQQIYYDTKTHRTGGYTSETVANHTAASVIDITKTNTTINKYANAYIENSDFVLAKMENGSSRGYVEFVWAKSYTDVVENGNQYLKESLLQDDPYQFLCDKAGDSYLRVLEDLAVKIDILPKIKSSCHYLC